MVGAIGDRGLDVVREALLVLRDRSVLAGVGRLRAGLDDVHVVGTRAGGEAGNGL